MERREARDGSGEQSVGIFGAVLLRGRMELHGNERVCILFAELFLQNHGAGLRKDRPEEHSLSGIILLPSSIFRADRYPDFPGRPAEEEIQRKRRLRKERLEAFRRKLKFAKKTSPGMGRIGYVLEL